MGQKDAPLQFLQISWEVIDPQGRPVVVEAMLCLRHRQEIASRFPGVRGTGQHGESCDLCERHYLGPRTSEADTVRLLSAPRPNNKSGSQRR